MLWFAMSLMAKPMFVTLPLVWLLLDYWPLKRLAFPLEFRTQQSRKIFVEKAPFLSLSTASCILTYLVQQRGGAMQMMEPMPLSYRIANAIVSYAQYIIDMFWPARLAVLYPFPLHWQLWQIAGAAAILLVISASSIMLARRAPHLLVGWLWYLGTLVPVIGLVQVGEQARADRYTYFPLVGLFIMAAWSVPALKHDRGTRWTYAAAATAIGIALAILTRRQLSYWQDSATLYQRAITVTTNNYTAHNNLGLVLAKRGSIDEALEHFQTAVAINSRLPEAHSSIGDVHALRGENDQAIASYQEALALDPTMPAANVGIAALLYKQGNVQEAIAHFETAMKRDPETKNIQFNLGLLYAATGRLDEALKMYEWAARLDPNRLDVREQLARVRQESQRRSP